MILFIAQPYVEHIPKIQDGHSSCRIILKKKRKKSSFLPDNTFFISSTKRAERPTDNSWLLSASFKAGAVTWMSHFYFIHFFIGMVSARRSIRSLRREDRLRGGAFLRLRPFHIHKPPAIRSHHNQAFLHLVTSEPELKDHPATGALLVKRKRKPSIYIFQLPADEPYESVWGHMSNASKHVKNRGSMINLIKKLWVLGKTASLNKTTFAFEWSHLSKMIRACGNLESMYVLCYEIALFDRVFFLHARIFFLTR